MCVCVCVCGHFFLHQNNLRMAKDMAEFISVASIQKTRARHKAGKLVQWLRTLAPAWDLGSFPSTHMSTLNCLLLCAKDSISSSDLCR